jgi:mono/diheme cytochrome c family protein
MIWLMHWLKAAKTVRRFRRRAGHAQQYPAAAGGAGRRRHGARRADVEAIDIQTTLGDLLNLFEQSGHSRMPIYADTLDDPAAWSTSATS